jgi:hypothetical protein
VVNPVYYKKKRSLNDDNIRGNALNFSFLIPLKEKEKEAKRKRKV